jgi:hypothetical protein
MSLAVGPVTVRLMRKYESRRDAGVTGEADLGGIEPRKIRMCQPERQGDLSADGRKTKYVNRLM